MLSQLMSLEFTKKIKKKAKEFGAVVVGVADAGLYDLAPEKHKPTDILANATSVISIGVPMSRAVLQESMPTQYTRSIFSSTAYLEQIAFQLSIWLESVGYDSIPIPARGPLYMEALSGKIMGDLSHKHTAALAGLGEIGVCTLLINPDYGTRLMLTSIVTNADVVPDRPFEGSLCLGDSCMECVKVCPVNALSPSGEIDKVRCSKYYRQFQEVFFETWGVYACWECRKVCSRMVEKKR